MLTTDDEPTGRYAIDALAAGPLILLAEDDDEMRNLIARKLRRAGYDVIEAIDGARLAALLDECRHGPLLADGRLVELVVSDIRMPGLTGIEAVSLLRSTDWSVPVILITAFGDRDTHSEAMRLGAVLLDKPLDLDELVFAARRLIVQ